jgi:hypothetical protein
MPVKRQLGALERKLKKQELKEAALEVPLNLPIQVVQDRKRLRSSEEHDRTSYLQIIEYLG